MGGLHGVFMDTEREQSEPRISKETSVSLVRRARYGSEREV